MPTSERLSEGESLTAYEGGGRGVSVGSRRYRKRERGRGRTAVTGHRDERLATVKRLDHADLGVRCAARDDEGKHRELVDLVVREAVELGGRHDHGVDGLLAHRVDLAREDADLEGDGASGGGVVAREHVDLDAGAVALAHGPLGLGARRVVQADEAEQGHALLELGAVVVAVRGRRAGERLGGEGEDAKALLGERLDVGEDLLLRLVVDRLGAVGRLDRVAHLDEALDGALHEDELLPASRAS